VRTTRRSASGKALPRTVPLGAELVAFYFGTGRTLDRRDQRRHQRTAGVVEGGDMRHDR
jgi:hypothetical protein